MDEKTMQEVRSMLLSRWHQFGKEAGRDFGEAAETNLNQAEIIDIAQSLEQIGRDTSLAEQGRKELLAVERALAKMASGSFGVCEDCGEEIPPRRLMVLPEARLCAGCQAYEEREQARMRSTGASAR